MKLLLVLIVVCNVALAQNNWGFYAGYNIQNIMPQQNSNGSYTYSNSTEPKEKKKLFAGLRDKFNSAMDRIAPMRQERKEKRWERKEAYYACLQSGATPKECRQQKREQRKVDLAEIRAERKEIRAERKAERKQKRIERRIARLDKKRMRLLNKLNN